MGLRQWFYVAEPMVPEADRARESDPLDLSTDPAARKDMQDSRSLALDLGAGLIGHFTLSFSIRVHGGDIVVVRNSRLNSVVCPGARRSDALVVWMHCDFFNPAFARHGRGVEGLGTLRTRLLSSVDVVAEDAIGGRGLPGKDHTVVVGGGAGVGLAARHAAHQHREQEQ